MRRCLGFLAGFLVVFASAMLPPALAQDDAAKREVETLPWEPGPGLRTVHGADATYRQSSTQLWLGGQIAARALFLSQGTDEWTNVVGLLVDPGLGTRVVIEHLNTGYIADIDWNDFEAAVVLDLAQELLEESNAERSRSGYPTLELLGYAAPPQYDEDLDTVHWAFRYRNSNGVVGINASAMVLSRDGFSVITWSGPTHQFRGRATLAAAVEAYSFNEGARYADYRPGDALAGVGLAALATRLITGRDATGAGRAGRSGLAAILSAAAKIGWAVLIIPFLFIGRLFRRGRSL